MFMHSNGQMLIIIKIELTKYEYIDGYQFVIWNITCCLQCLAQCSFWLSPALVELLSNCYDSDPKRPTLLWNYSIHHLLYKNQQFFLNPDVMRSSTIFTWNLHLCITYFTQLHEHLASTKTYPVLSPEVQNIQPYKVLM